MSTKKVIIGVIEIAVLIVEAVLFASVILAL